MSVAYNNKFIKMKNKLFITLLIILLAIVSNACDKKPSGDENDLLKKVTYTESSEILINPERGFYHHVEFNTRNSNTLSLSTVAAQRKLNRSLILTIYYMYDFRDKPITEEFLERIVTNMNVLREGGSKCVLRFAYTSSEKDKPWDAPQELVLQHIQQLKPIIQEHADVIFLMEAGFVGVWGEWYYTSNFGMTLSTPEDYAPRRSVLDALLSALPPERMICVRTPVFKLRCFDIGYGDTLTLQTAYNGSDLSRIAGHNDCFLASSNDMGTYSNNSQREFWQAESRYTAMGGETCGVSSYSVCENALEQMEKYHFTYLNSGYHQTVLANWKTEGCYSEIETRMGYRFVLTEAHFTPQAEAGKEFVAKIRIKNVGYAAPVNPRGLELVFVSKQNNNQKYIVKLDNDPRFWLAGGEYLINTTYTLPLQMAGEEYDLFLNLPDPQPLLYGKPEYSIRLANEDVWDENTGYNKIYNFSVQ